MPSLWCDNATRVVRPGAQHEARRGCDDIKGFQQEYGGAIWEPAPLLERLVAEGKTFASLQG